MTTGGKMILSPGMLHQASLRLQSLLEILLEEHDALRERDMPTLQLCTERKAAAIDELEKLGVNAEAGSRPDITHNEDTRKFDSLLQRCQEQNRINGSIIAISLQFSQRILQIIKGDNENRLYAPTGKNTQDSPGHILARI